MIDPHALEELGVSDADVRLASVLSDVVLERLRQERKCEQKREEGRDWKTCADPRMIHEEKLAVLVEEVGEVARELCDARAQWRDPAPNLRVELIQLAAVAVAWAEALDTQEGTA